MNRTNSERFPLDALDLKILHALQDDGRIANVALAVHVGLSPSSTLERVKRLERSGVIQGFTARINRKALGHDVVVFVQLTMREHDRKALTQFEMAVVKLSEVLECHHVAGDYDFLLKVLAKDVDSLRRLLVDRISELPSVGRIHSLLVLDTVKHVLDVPLSLAESDVAESR